MDKNHIDGCYGCRCNICARNVDLGVEYTTVGEIKEPEELCFNCDDCCLYSGDEKLTDNYKKVCKSFVEAQKYSEHEAQKRRERFAAVIGNKYIKNGNYLNDRAVILALGKLKTMYENGEIIEVADICDEIAQAIYCYEG